MDINPPGSRARGILSAAARMDKSAHTSRCGVFDEGAPRNVFYFGHGITGMGGDYLGRFRLSKVWRRMPLAFDIFIARISRFADYLQSVVMRYEFSNGISQCILTKEDHLIQAAFFDAADEAFGVRIQIR